MAASAWKAWHNGMAAINKKMAAAINMKAGEKGHGRRQNERKAASKARRQRAKGGSIKAWRRRKLKMAAAYENNGVIGGVVWRRQSA